MSAVDAERLAATQADIASSPLLARRVVVAAGIPGLSEGNFERNSSASASSVADVLSFSVTNHSPRRAAFLATIFAQQYTVLRRDLDTSALKDAIRNVQAKIDSLTASGALSTQLSTQLLATKTRLETAAALQTDNALVIRPATVPRRSHRDPCTTPCSVDSSASFSDSRWRSSGRRSIAVSTPPRKWRTAWDSRCLGRCRNRQGGSVAQRRS